MKKLIVIALLLSALIKISSTISFYSIISDAEHVLDDNNRIPKKLQPVELMVDATNHLGFTVLNLHSKLNKNNIAFSPCGLISVLIALYEGSGGRSAVEIKEAIKFPRERDIIRIGTRDIHRRLRSYFYKKENLLSGLIFNKENITIRQEYESLLRFYGYDLDGASNMMTDSRVELDQMNNTMESTDSYTPQISGSTTMTTETPTTIVSSILENQENVTEQDGESVTSTTQPEEKNEDGAITTNETNDADYESENMTTTVASTRKRRGRLGRGLRSKIRKDKEQPSSPYLQPKHSAMKMKRRSRSYEILDYENEYNLDIATHRSSISSLSSTSPIPSTTISFSTSPQQTSNKQNFYHHYHPPLSTESSIHTFGPTLAEKRRINNHKDLFENVNSDTIEHIFYLNEHENVRVPYKIYDTVMKYAYINSFQTSILEIELDSEHYNLILMVPDYQDGLNTLINKLKGHPANTLRYIRDSMDFHWIKTIVPKFNVKGNSILTSDLQSMGIVDIFEPAKADFSVMSDDDKIYVKNVEQMININIRTQSTQQLKKITSLFKRPIEVPVNIPFLYCVVDKKLDLLIILGRILNPLNSRIQ